ncbi:C6 finger domain-containing protein [Metarhizium robertsii ARSEF 23]|uniref:C6 finger domain-containing protein n=1 Tax=Metarhizium robertsii (strain ARSEF 23 / ATCC MYA-3075) TaxID=655844 RepID=A0A0B2XI16_METRA|nr:C6 finger domain-containing protein [Metarhizium robertsii ARSEF 23]KHO11526.1 C6 finger domain-containing protein [Metarhizium robertsii ARSEF 23]
MAFNLTVSSFYHQVADHGSFRVLSWGQISLIAFVSYVSLCSFLRFRRVNKLRQRYPYPDRASLAQMTSEEAQVIVQNICSYEFPYFFDLSQQYALFRTYAVENIAKLLVSVSDLNKSDQSPKRYEDTEIIFVCFAHYAPTSSMLRKAVARMNYLHAPYIKSGRILNKDLLYVLSTAMSEPERFMRLYEWRPLLEMEVAAVASVWKYVGDLMEIDYEAELGKNQWRDAIEFLDDVSQWASKYEEQYMRPMDEFAQLGSVLMDLLLSAYPRALRPLGFPEPGVAVCALTYTLLLLRKLFLRYLSLPRFSRVVFVTEPDPTSKRMKHLHYLKEPWYTPATFWWRWGPTAWATWAAGGMVPGDNEEMKPEGFLWEDIGPRSKMGKGSEEMAKLEEVVQQRATGKCPFAVPSKT